jgi:hypothetical protein
MPRQPPMEQFGEYMVSGDHLAGRVLVAVWHNSQQEIDDALLDIVRHRDAVLDGTVDGFDADTPLASLDSIVPLKTIGMLERHGVSTVADFVVIDCDELLRIHGVGRKTVADLKKLQSQLKG